jgi:hypothetical protein
MKARKPAIAAAGTFLSLFTFSQLYQRVLFDKITPISERREEKQWVASSQSWVDRKVCNWFGFCGLAHLNKAGWTTPQTGRKAYAAGNGESKVNLTEFWESANTSPEQWSDEERILREVPGYVLEHAPYIHLYSGEKFWPCDIAEHLIHTTPHLNYTALQASSDHPNLTDLNDLNRWGPFVYLQSDDNVEDRPQWLGGETNIPSKPDDSDPGNWADWEDHTGATFKEDKDGEEEPWFHAGVGDTRDKGGVRPPSGAITSPVPVPTDTPEGEQLVYEGKPRDDKPGHDEPRHDEPHHEIDLIRRGMGKKVVGGRSDAPAVLIVVEKGDGVVDAFFFFFYSYNLGNKVFNVRFGNHVGDWEHTVVRFQHGEPKAVFFSEHSFGEAYRWDAVEKIGKRPIGFSATGSHAMYATPGVHPYILPGGILHDVTDRGPLWDPLLNLKSYTYDYQRDILRSSALTPRAPTEWFYFMGHWGDKFYPLSDPRQYRFMGQYHYVDGPLGPRYKNLGREKICQGNNECILEKSVYTRRSRIPRRYPDLGEGERMSEEDNRRFVGPASDHAL